MNFVLLKRASIQGGHGNETAKKLCNRYDYTATTANLSARWVLGDVVLLVILEGIPEEKGLDILESLPVEGFDAGYRSKSYRLPRSDVVRHNSRVAR